MKKQLLLKLLIAFYLCELTNYFKLKENRKILLKKLSIRKISKTKKKNINKRKENIIKKKKLTKLYQNLFQIPDYNFKRCSFKNLIKDKDINNIPRIKFLSINT